MPIVKWNAKGYRIWGRRGGSWPTVASAVFNGHFIRYLPSGFSRSEGASSFSKSLGAKTVFHWWLEACSAQTAHPPFEKHFTMARLIFGRMGRLPVSTIGRIENQHLLRSNSKLTSCRGHTERVLPSHSSTRQSRWISFRRPALLIRATFTFYSSVSHNM
jgi:hypothetical protein